MSCSPRFGLWLQTRGGGRLVLVCLCVSLPAWRRSRRWPWSRQVIVCCWAARLWSAVRTVRCSASMVAMMAFILRFRASSPSGGHDGLIMGTGSRVPSFVSFTGGCIWAVSAVLRRVVAFHLFLCLVLRGISYQEHIGVRLLVGPHGPDANHYAPKMLDIPWDR